MPNKKAASPDRPTITIEDDFPTTERFLQVLDPSGLFSFQAFGDKIKDPGLTKILHGTFKDHRAELARLNASGAGIFVTVSRTDGKGRKVENITGIRAVFVDLDGAPLPDEWPIEPHLIVETSPGRWHAYWIVENFPLDRFESVQKVIATRFRGDQSITDLPRVMRLPGFIHRKGEPFQTRIVRDWGEEPPYSEKQILEAFPPADSFRNEIRTAKTDDPILKKLTEKGMVVRQDRAEKGKYVIACPWADHHTNGDNEAVYWLPNHGGFKGPGYKCLHSHCTNRTTKDLTEWLGIRKESKAPEIFIRRLSEVQAKPVEWLWPGYLPLGALCLFDGDPCNGKSFLTQNLAAKVSAGGIFPTGERATPGGVVLLSYEDDPGVTIRPRLETMLADLNRIVLLEGLKDDKGPRLPHIGDIPAIREAVEDIRARLVIIDPLMAALPGGVDSHSDQNIRSVLAPLSKLAQETSATVLVVRHLNKSGSGNALYRGGGSIGIVAAARAAFLVAKDPEDEERRVLAVTKMNIAPEPSSLAYRISVNAEGNPFLSWEGESDLTARDLLTPEDKPRNAPKRDLARKFLEDRLKNGPVASETILQESLERNISQETLKRVKKEMGILSHREGGSDGEWFWSLKDVKPPIRKVDDTLCREGMNTGDFKECQPQKKKEDSAIDTLSENGSHTGNFQRVSRSEREEIDLLPVEDI